MNRSKRIFFLAAILFVIVLAWLAYDFAKHTKFRGSTNMIQSKGDSPLGFVPAPWVEDVSQLES